MVAASIVETYVDYITSHRHVSIVELQRLYEKTTGDSGHGDVAIVMEKNIVLYTGMSEAFADSLEELRMSGQVEPAPANWLVYLVDGGVPGLPIVKRLPRRGYKEPHWLPVVFNPVKAT